MHVAIVLTLVLPLGDGKPEKVPCLCGSARTQVMVWCAADQRGFAFGVDVPSRRIFRALEGVEVKPGALECPTCKEALANDGSCGACHLHFAGGKSYRSWAMAAIARGVPVTKELVESLIVRGDGGDAERVHPDGDRSGADDSSGEGASLDVERPRKLKHAARGEGESVGGASTISPVLTTACGKCIKAMRAGLTRVTEPLPRARVDKGFAPCDWCAGCRIGLVGNRIFRNMEPYTTARRADHIMKQWGTHCEMCDIAILTDGECIACHMTFINGIMTKGKRNPYDNR